VDQQGPAPGEVTQVHVDEAVKRLQGRIVRAIRIARQASDRNQASPFLDEAAANPLVRSLESRVGRPFEPSKVSADCANLWNERRIVTSAYAEEADAEVVLTFLIEREVETYERIEFRGLVRYDRATVDSLLGLYADRPVTSTEADAMRKVLLARYRRDGFAFCSIQWQERQVDDLAPDDKSKPVPAGAPVERSLRRVQFQIDEGPRVTVRTIHLHGNTSFPGSAAFGLFGAGNYLLRDSHILSDPPWGLGRGESYSREVIEEDLDRLRLFYRSRGFLDATVDLALVQFSADRTEVDLGIVVVEGPRYKLRSLRIEHVGADGKPVAAPPRYPAEEIQKELVAVAGEYYDHARLQRDWLAIQEFYGRRGHPPRNFPGMRNDASASEVSWPPREIYGEAHEVDVVFEVFEGVPKSLRDVVIRGNQYTRDAVIRRRIKARPGAVIDMVEVNRSLRNIEQSGYFNDLISMSRPRVQLEPVPGQEDVVDLAVDVQDGQTGELKWGIGISTGQGASASIQFNKRNFDLWNPPSSFNPITAISEMLDNKAFHGGGQTFGLLLAPGSRYSQFRISYFEPDIFNDHDDTYGLRTEGHRIIRRLPDGYTSDTLGAEIGLDRNFSEHWNAGLSLRQDSVEIDNLAPDATAIAFDAEGQTELRGLRLTARYRDYDDVRRPTSGVEFSLSGEVVGGFLGGEESLTKLLHSAHVYVPLHENEMGHRTVFHFEHLLGVANEFGGSDDVFLTERFYMGGGDLRGFNYRGAGPSQFDRPIGGEAVYKSSVEVTFPLVATRLENEVRDRELLRGAIFTDLGLLGLGLDDPTFGELRLSSGFGIRIEVPYLEVPISLDLAWPWFYEETDDRRQFFFSISR